MLGWNLGLLFLFFSLLVCRAGALQPLLCSPKSLAPQCKKKQTTGRKGISRERKSSSGNKDSGPK